MMAPARRFPSARRPSALVDDGAPRLFGAVVEQGEGDEPVCGHGSEGRKDEDEQKKREKRRVSRATMMDAGSRRRRFGFLFFVFSRRRADACGLCLSLRAKGERAGARFDWSSHSCCSRAREKVESEGVWTESKRKGGEEVLMEMSARGGVQFFSAPSLKRRKNKGKKIKCPDSNEACGARRRRRSTIAAVMLSRQPPLPSLLPMPRRRS